MTVTHSTYRLAHPNGRRYTFTPLPSGDILVRRYQGLQVTDTFVRTRPKARSLWAWLLKIGYQH